MKVLALVRSIDPDGLGSVSAPSPRLFMIQVDRKTHGTLARLGRGGTEVLDMTEYMTAAVLGSKVAKVGAQTHVSRCRLVQAPFSYRQVLEEHKAAAVEDIIADLVEVRFELGQRKECL